MQTIKVDNARWVRNARKKVEKQNRAFAKASKRERIVLVAKDVISLLALGAINPTQGTYFEAYAKADKKFKVHKDMEIQKVLANPVGRNFPTCNVCAIGAAMLSSIRIKDNFSFGDASESTGSHVHGMDYEKKKLNEVRSFSLEHKSDEQKTPWETIFGSQLLSDMEEIFEHNTCSIMSDLTDPTLIMFAVYENIVANNGVLKPLRPTWADRDGYDCMSGEIISSDGKRELKDWRERVSYEDKKDPSYIRRVNMEKYVKGVKERFEKLQALAKRK